MKTLALVSLTLIAAASPALAQPDVAKLLPPTFGGRLAVRQPVDLSAQLEEIRAAAKVPAVCAAVIDREGIIAHGVAGTRRAGGTTPVTLNDKWHLGSCTKAMTGTLCGLLVADGTLKWDSNIGDVFNPGREEKARITNNWRLVTVRQMVTCTANAPYDLGEYGGRPLWANLWEKHRSGVAPKDQRAYLLGELVRNNIAPPGYSYQYANASLALAGHTAETAAGMPYEDLMTARVFRPLGMTTAGFGAPGTATADDEPEDQPWGHDRAGRPVRPGVSADNPASIAPAGTAHMSIDDWARFARLHLLGAEITLPASVRFDADQPEPEWDPAQTLGLGPTDFATLHAPGFGRTNDYAAGWIIASRPWARGDQPAAIGRCLTHVGSNTMWTASIWIAPEIGRAYLAVVNTGAPAGSDARENALQAMIALDRQWRGLPPLK